MFSRSPVCSLLFRVLPSAPRLPAVPSSLRSLSESSSLLLPARSFSSRSSDSSSYFVLNGVPMTSNGSFPLAYAVRLIQALRAGSHFKDVERVSLCVNLNLDPKKPNQSLKGTAILPHGTGQTIRVAVFARGAKAEEAKNAGAEIVGEMDLVEMIQAGKFEFDRLIATPDTMALVGRVARILGPRGLMPNPKLGTVTNDLTTAIRSAKAGQAQFKTDKFGIVHAPVGKLSFSGQALRENIEAIVEAIQKHKPSGAKGKYVKSAYLSCTQGGSVQVDINSAPFKSTKINKVAASAPASEPAADAKKPVSAAAAPAS